ncbi:MAG: glycosyltransferase family 2 protein [Actinobacteria bacterium]|nr:MAG: glycosyltransferase family 2 protein [Actinomycetota bacterium]
MLLSVIIPTRNREDVLSGLLGSLARQPAVPFEWEVLVVDNDSSDDTAERTREATSDFPVPLQYVLETELGLHAARHRGAYEANGEIVAFLDDDMLVEQGWVRGVLPIQEGRADAVMGRILPKWLSSPPEWLYSLCHTDGDNMICGYLGILDLGDETRPLPWHLVFGGNLFIPKQLLFRLGGFNPDSLPPDMLRFRGDGESGLMARFQQEKLASVYEPTATVYHLIDSDRLSREYLARRAFNQGISASFTDYRSRNGLAPQLALEPLRSRALTGLLALPAGSALVTAARKLKRLLSPKRPLPASDVREEMDEAFRRGWLFHRREVRRDEAVRRRLLKETYLDEGRPANLHEQPMQTAGGSS